MKTEFSALPRGKAFQGANFMSPIFQEVLACRSFLLKDCLPYDSPFRYWVDFRPTQWIQLQEPLLRSGLLQASLRLEALLLRVRRH